MVAPDDSVIELVTAGGAVFAPTVGIASLLDDYADPVLIWGGAQCDTVGGVETCFGYPPTGVILIAIAVAMVVGYGVSVLALRDGD